MPLPLDLNFVRVQFPAFSEAQLQGQVFFESAGGTYCCRQVIDRLCEYYRRLKVQPYYGYAASSEAGHWMDAAHAQLAAYFGVAADEIHFGPSTSQNTYVLAQALRRMLRPGDEIVITDQDHEANIGVWRRLAADGAVIRTWHVDPASGALDPATLERLLTERTRLVAFTHCSNLLGHINPVAQIAQRVRAAGALSVVDGVGYAPHGLPDVPALGADIYLCSLYKIFGPHQGVMTIRRSVLERLSNEGHEFNFAQPHKRLVPAGPDHAQIAAARGVAEYFDALDAHHGGAHDAGRPRRVRDLLRRAERPLLAGLLDDLAARAELRVLGPTNADARTATVSFVSERLPPAEIAARLAAQGVMAASGNFYAPRLLEAMRLDPALGVVRLSFLHYSTLDDILQLLKALDTALL